MILIRFDISTSYIINKSTDWLKGNKGKKGIIVGITNNLNLGLV